MERPDPIRVFVSSPSDVAAERAACLRSIGLLNRRYAGVLELQGVFWEDHFFPSTMDFQSWINEQIPPWKCALVVYILWSRIGSPLARTWPQRPDGTPYESGTVAEFEMTLPYARSGELPDLYMFVKTAAPAAGASALDLRRAAEAKAVVEKFVQRWFHQAVEDAAEGGVLPFTAGLNPFRSTDAFEEMFVRFLESWLREKGWIDRKLTWDRHRQGLPYVGLAAFTASHSPVFFGRDADRRAARRLLIEAARSGLAYLLLVGASGVGKSSLACAGLIADICVDTPQEAWSACVMLAGADPLLRFANALFADGCDLAPGFCESFFPDAARLGPALADPAVAVSVMHGVLDRRSRMLAAENGWDSLPAARLLLVLDQAEALLDASAASQERLVKTLAALVASGRVWLVLTLRLDRMSALLDTPLAPLVTRNLRGLGPEGEELKLCPPDGAAIRDIIEAPAAAAGLSFEEQAGVSLADALRMEVAGEPDALPLLQHLLTRLFRDAQVASWSAYDRIGRLPGAIAAAASAALDGLSAAARSALRPLVLGLAASMTDDGSVLSRTMDRSAFETDAERAALVAALLRERLLAVDERGQLRVTHEALLRAWPEAREILARNADIIRLRRRLESPVAEWRQGGPLLSPGPLFASAAALLPEMSLELAMGDMATFVGASVANERRGRRRRSLILSTIAAVFALLAATAGLMGHRAAVARDNAERNFNAADGAVRSLIDDLALGLRDQEGISAAAISRILDTAEDALNGLLRTAPDDVRLLQLQSSGKNVIAETLLTRGQTSAAHQAAAASVGISRHLVAQDPANVLSQGNLAESSLALGSVLFIEGNLPAAIGYFQAGLAIASRLAVQHPADARWQHDLAILQGKVAAALSQQGDMAGALTQYRAAIAATTRLAAADPDNVSLQRDLATSDMGLGDALLDRGDLSGALAAYRADLAIGVKAVRADPGNTRWQRSLGISHVTVGDVLSAQGDLAGAIAEYRASLAIGRDLVAKDASNANWQFDVYIAQQDIGDVLVLQGDLPGAALQHRGALATIVGLTGRDRGNAEWQRDAAIAHNRLGSVFLAQGDLLAALGEYRQAEQITIHLLALDPSNADWQDDAATSHLRLADVSLAEGRPGDALNDYRAALTMTQALVTKDDSNTSGQYDLAASQQGVGDAERALGNLPSALGAYTAALHISQALVAHDGSDLDWQRGVVVAEQRLAAVLLALGHGDVALATDRDAFARATALAARNAGNTACQHDLVVSEQRLGDALSARGEAVQAAAADAAALRIAKRLAAEDPSNHAWAMDVQGLQDKVAGEQPRR